jgi:hypothetical protein
LNTACFALRKLFHVLRIYVLRMVCLAYFHKYRIIFWENSINTCRVFTLEKRIITIMSAAGSENWCRHLFKKLDVLLASCKHILLFIFVVNKQEIFQTKLSVHRLDTSVENKLYLLTANLLCFREVFPTLLWRCFVSLPNNMKNI